MANSEVYGPRGWPLSQYCNVVNNKDARSCDEGIPYMRAGGVEMFAEWSRGFASMETWSVWRVRLRISLEGVYIGRVCTWDKRLLFCGGRIPKCIFIQCEYVTCVKVQGLVTCDHHTFFRSWGWMDREVTVMTRILTRWRTALEN